MLDILVIKCLTDNFSYLIRDTNTNTIGVVDPSEFSAVDNEIQKKYKKLDFILNTHHHDDHIGGNLDLKKKYNSKIVCSEHDKNTIIDADVLFNDGDSFKGGHAMTIVGYNNEGFIIRNSWGRNWNEDGYTTYFYKSIEHYMNINLILQVESFVNKHLITKILIF